MSDLNCSEYSEKAIVVRGEATKTYKENLKSLGGKYNASLKGGAGWIFTKTNEGKVNKFISSVNRGEVKASDPIEEPQHHRTFSSSYDSRMSGILQDIKTLLQGKDSDYKLAFLTSVTLLLTDKSTPTPPVQALKPMLRQQPKTEVVISSSDEEEEEAPPRRRLLK